MSGTMKDSETTEKKMFTYESLKSSMSRNQRMSAMSALLELICVVGAAVLMFSVFSCAVLSSMPIDTAGESHLMNK